MKLYVVQLAEIWTLVLVFPAWVELIFGVWSVRSPSWLTFDWFQVFRAVTLFLGPPFPSHNFKRLIKMVTSSIFLLASSLDKGNTADFQRLKHNTETISSFSCVGFKRKWGLQFSSKCLQRSMWINSMTVNISPCFSFFIEEKNWGIDLCMYLYNKTFPPQKILEFLGSGIP